MHEVDRDRIGVVHGLFEKPCGTAATGSHFAAEFASCPTTFHGFGGFAILCAILDLACGDVADQVADLNWVTAFNAWWLYTGT